MKLTIGQAQSLLMAIENLDAKIGAGDIRLSGAARIAHLVNMRLLQPHVAAFQQVRNERFAEIVGPGVNLADLTNPAVDIPPQKRAEFIFECVGLLNGECEVALITYKTADLNLDDNPTIAPSLIEQLSPMISDLPTAAITNIASVPESSAAAG